MFVRILALLLVLFGSLIWASEGAAKVLRVPGEFNKIQDAMLKARHGDTVLVGPGRYEGPVDVKNGVILESTDGPEKTTIVALRWWVVRLADADTLTALIGFTVSGARAADRSVYCSGGGSPRVLNNIIEKGWYGVSCEGSSAIVRDNLVRFNKQGIQCDNASPIVTRNHVTRNYTGFVVKNSSPRLTNNVIDQNGIGIRVEEYSNPIVGGSLEEANDIFDNNRLDLVNLGKVKEDAIRTLQPLLLQVEYNFWGSECPDKSRFKGDIDFKPWVDRDHEKKFTSCP